MRGLLLTAIILALSPPPIPGDELELADGGSLQGTILSISPDGVISADLEVADKPVEIQTQMVSKVRFGAASRNYDHDTMITLINGDRLPCELTGVSETDVTVTTGYAGDLTIPRKIIDTAQLGIRPRKSIYSGPKSLKQWTVDDNWQYEDSALVSEGRGSVSRSFDKLPDSFALSFNLEWADKPMFKVFFSSESTKTSGGKHDRYYLQINAASIEIKRQSSGQNTFHSLMTVNRTHDSFPDKSARFDIRFDHRQRKLLLYIDGQLETQAIDPLSSIPKGKILILQSDASESQAHRVSGIKLQEWDAAGQRHRSEDRGDFGEDALISNKGERFGGRLSGSKGNIENMIMLFKSPLAPKALEIPTIEISTLFFEKQDADVEASTPLVLVLAESGILGAGSCTFSPKTVQLTHPLLGPLVLDRKMVKVLQRRKWPEDRTPPSSSSDTEE